MVLVMSADGEDMDGRIVETIYQSIPVGQATRPESREIVLQGFGLARANAGVAALKLFEDSAEIAV